VAEERPFAGPGAGRSLDSPVPATRHRAVGRQGASSVPLPRLDLAALIDLLPDAIIVAGTTGHIRLANAAAGRLYRIDPANLVGRSLVSLAPEWARAAYAEVIEEFASSGKGQFMGGPPVRATGLRCDGTEVDVEVTMGAIEQLDEPRPGLVVAVRDVGEYVRLERELRLTGYLRAAIESASDGVMAVAVDGRILAVNQHFRELWGLTDADMRPGEPSREIFQFFADRVADVNQLRITVEAQSAAPTERQPVELRLNDGRVLLGEVAPISGPGGNHLGRIWFLRDETQRIESERQRQVLLERLHQAHRAQDFLLRASDVLARASGYAETLERLAAVAVPTLGDLCLIDVLTDDGRVLRMAARHADPALQPLADELRRDYPPALDSGHPGAAVIADGQSRWSDSMPEDFLLATTRGERHLQLVQELGFTSYMSVALVAEGNVLGSMTVVSAGSGRRFGPPDLQLTEELAGRVALVVAKTRRYEREQRTSHTLQGSLLPSTLPQLAGVSMAVRYLPGTRGAEVGGDFFDAVLLRSDSLAVVVGDVAGHDVTAAATMGQLRTAYRALVRRAQDPADMIRLLQDSWDDLGTDRIATASFGEIDTRTGRLRLASAGHLPPCLVHNGQAAFLPVESSVPLGMSIPGLVVDIQQWEGELPVGAALVLYTDGLVEERSRDISEGMSALLAAAQAAGTNDPDVIADQLLSELAGESRGDDVALLVLRRD
jgi:PAS domain S-box-containing protein